MPFGGKNQLTPTEAMAAKIPLLKGDTTTGTLMSYGYNPNISKWSPFHGAAYAVVESVAKIVAAGGTHKDIRLSFQEYFERLGEDASKWGKPFSALLGAFVAQMAIGIPAIGGKDSMSGTFKDLTVPPTLISFAVNVVNVNNVISPEFKKAGNKVVYVHLPVDEYELPDFNALDKLYTQIESFIKAGKIISAHTVKAGGIAEAVTKMCFGNSIGVKFDNEIKAEDLFKPNYGSFVFEVEGEAKELLKAVNGVLLGSTQQKASIEVLGAEIKLTDAIVAWTTPLEKVFPTKADVEDSLDLTIKPYTFTGTRKKGSAIAKPRVFIPVFPGTNCEYDSAKVFEKAGAHVDTLVIRNLTKDGLEESIQKATKLIEQSQIVMLPGGFSAGDEPDGSGKFIAAFFRNPRITEEVSKLLNHRDGLMLGICNGFQALIKLGLVPYGEIRDMDDNSPTLTFNNIGRHVSCLVDTKIVSNKSPWLSGVNTGDVHTIAVSHGEGRFIADQATMQTLIANGQIATQYVDAYGNPSYDIEHNPNASMYAIEGITSPDGRVLGKMGHSERIGSNLYKNVPGAKDQKIFESGVNYFK
jgi:phosphoribosylformylglycinamidine synthase